MSDLFADAARERLPEVAPLAMRLRPRSLDEFVGQQHILGPHSALRLAIAADGVECLYMQDTWLVTADGGVPLAGLEMKVFD